LEIRLQAMFHRSCALRSTTRSFPQWNLIFSRTRKHSPFVASNASLVVRQRGCAITWLRNYVVAQLRGCAFACSRKQTFVQCKFLQGNTGCRHLMSLCRIAYGVIFAGPASTDARDENQQESCGEISKHWMRQWSRVDRESCQFFVCSEEDVAL